MKLRKRFSKRYQDSETQNPNLRRVKSAGESEVTMKKYEVVIERPNGKGEVIHKSLTEEQAIKYINFIDNTYYREQEC